MLRSDAYDGGEFGEADERLAGELFLLSVFMRFVLRMRRNWSVRSLAHVSDRPAGGCGLLRLEAAVRSAIVIDN